MVRDILPNHHQANKGRHPHVLIQTKDRKEVAEQHEYSRSEDTPAQHDTSRIAPKGQRSLKTAVILHYFHITSIFQYLSIQLRTTETKEACLQGVLVNRLCKVLQITFCLIAVLML